MMKLTNPLTCLVIFALIVQNHSISDKRLCVDENCVGVISLARAVRNYTPNQEGILAFKANSEIKIKSKSAHSTLWGVEIDGKDGYAPQMFVQEYKILHQFDTLVVGIPKVAAPKQSKSKLKSSEKAKPPLKVTTTAPLPTELDNEKILTNVGEKEVVTVDSVIVTPSQPSVVVDGTAIPVDTAPVNKSVNAADEDDHIVEDIDFDSTNKNTSINNLTKADDEEEYDSDDDEDDDDEYDEDEFIEDEIEEAVPLKPVPLKAEFITEPEKQVEKKTETPLIGLHPSLLQNEASKMDSNPDVDYSPNEKATVNEAKVQKLDPKFDSKLVPTEEIQEDQFNVTSSGIESEKVVNQTENSAVDLLKPAVSAESSTESKPEVVSSSSEINLNETRSQGIDESGSVKKKGKDPAELQNTNISDKELSVESLKAPEVEAKVAVISNISELIANETAIANTEPDIADSVESEDAKEKPKSVETNSSESVSSLNGLKEILDNSTSRVKEAAVSDIVSQQVQLPNKNTLEKEDIKEQTEKQKDVPAAPVQKVTETTSQLDIVSTVTEGAKKATNEVPPATKSTPNIMDAHTVTDVPAEDNESGLFPILAEQSTPTSTSVNDQTTASTLNSPTVPGELASVPLLVDPSTATEASPVSYQENPYTLKPESVTDIPVQPKELNSIPILTDPPTNTNPPDISEPKKEEAPPVHASSEPAVDVTNVPDVVKTALPPVALNELLKSAETRSLNQVNPNPDLPSENEDTTVIPAPTEPAIDGPHSAQEEFDVTTPNPIPPVVAPAKTPPQQAGLFQTILGTVKGFLPAQEPITEFSDELDRILFHKKEEEVNNVPKNTLPVEYCERGDDCPSSYHEEVYQVERDFLTSLSDKVLELFDLLSCMVISAAATLLFTFGYYCIAQCRKESELISKLNVVERSLLVSHKETSILKHDLGETYDKLASIENNSFGSNDMVIAIKKELEISEGAKASLEGQVLSLEKELENAAEAGLELNKIVSELLNNQSGDESIISSVEELQRQLNEQQNTILEINAILADKSRENSELQLILAEQNAKFGGEIASLQQDNDELEAEKNVLKSKLDEMKTEFELDITKALEGKNSEIKRLQADIVGLRSNVEEEHRKWQTSVAKVEALEHCLKAVKRDPSVNVSQIIDVAHVQAELLDTKRQKNSLNEKLESEMDTRKLLEDQVKSFSQEVEKLKHDFHQSEKDKLEAQTRLEVLSNYFKDKENQLQKELSLKEAMWLKQQGETTSTVDRLTNMQDEIQTLKSQNDSLRAEIEAQIAAHKAQIGTLENRAHETWLAARQSERKYEEARSDATALRRKLTSLVGGNTHNLAKDNNLDVNLPLTDMNNAPSPVHMESPGSLMLGLLPFIPPPFTGPPPPHFMGMPPFIPPGEMRPPPMGRLMSPPPPPVAPHLHRYSPIDDDDDEDEIRENSRGHWRGTYSPPRQLYRYSPDRYMYNPDIISNYDTETDFSPPPSPRERSHRSGSRSGSYKAYSPPPQSTNNQSMDRPKKSSKGQMSSGSEKSYNSWKGKSKGMV